MTFEEEVKGHAAAILALCLQEEESRVIWRAPEPASPPLPKEKSEQGKTADFTSKEVAKMPKEFKKDYRAGKVTAHVRLKKGGVYEVRCMYRGVTYSGSSKNLDEAKARFVLSLSKEQTKKEPRQIPRLKDYMEEWLQLVKEPQVKENTYERYCTACRVHILPALGDYSLDSIPAFEVQALFNKLQSTEISVTDVCYHLLKACLDYAVADGLIDRSPMLRIRKPDYVPDKSRALTIDEEALLLASMQVSAPTSQACALMLYTGIRVSECASIRQEEDGFLSVVSAKQRKGAKETRRYIPVCPMLERLMPFIDLQAVRALKPSQISYAFKQVFPDLHVHMLRHTFITRAQECGVRREIVSLWAGHAPDSSITTQVYTHLEQNRELQKQEALKIDYTVITPK